MSIFLGFGLYCLSLLQIRHSIAFRFFPSGSYFSPAFCIFFPCNFLEHSLQNCSVNTLVFSCNGLIFIFSVSSYFPQSCHTAGRTCVWLMVRSGQCMQQDHRHMFPFWIPGSLLTMLNPSVPKNEAVVRNLSKVLQMVFLQEQLLKLQ